MQDRKFNLNLKEISITQDLNFGHAGSVWDASLVFGHYLQKNSSRGDLREYFKGKTVLEIGSGTGVAGILLGCLFDIKEIFLTDQQENLPILQANSLSNQIHSNAQFKVLPLEWSDIQQMHTVLDQIPQLDILLGSDLMYDDANTRILLKLFDAIADLRPNCEFWLAFNIRKTSDEEFIKQIKETYKAQEIPSSEFDNTYRDDDIGILRFMKQQLNNESDQKIS